MVPYFFVLRTVPEGLIIIRCSSYTCEGVRNEYLSISCLCICACRCRVWTYLYRNLVLRTPIFIIIVLRIFLPYLSIIGPARVHFAPIISLGGP